MANGDTKTEAMLNVLGNGGSGDEFRGCCNTKTQSYILDAIDRINAIQPGGGEDFTGATATTDGVHGLTPAPVAGDQDKFLKGDGTWSEVDYAKEASVIRTSTTQSQTASFIYRTTAGDMSIDTGEATLASIKGNAIMEGYHDEVKDYETNFADPNTTASIDWGTFIAWVNGKGWVDYSPFTLTWTGTPGVEWSVSNSAGGSTSDNGINLGITVIGNVAVDDTITITYSAATVGTITVAKPTSFVATGYNQYDSTAGYAHVVGNNQYRISGTYTSLGLATEVGGTTTPVTVTDGKFTPASDGYIYVTGGSGDILIALVWSGIKDNEPYAAYSESSVAIPTVDSSSTNLPTASYGMPKVGDVADELNFSERIYIKRIGQYDYSEANLETVQAMGVDYIFDLTNIFYVLETPVTYTLASTVSGAYTANDFGTEEFTGSDVPLEATIIYGNNLVDKLRNLADIQTIGNGLSLVDGLLSAAAAGGAGIKVLTTADYNYPANNPTSIGLWLLDPGLYFADSASMTVRVSTSDNASSFSDTFLVTQDPYPNGLVSIYTFGSPGSMNGDIGSALLRCYKVWKSNGGRSTIGAAATHSEIASVTGKLINQWTTKDWPTNSPDGVAIWKLRLQGDRFYFQSNAAVKIYITPNHYLSGNIKGTVDMLYMGGDSNKLLTSFDLQIFDRNTDTMTDNKGYGIVDWSNDTEIDYKTYTAS